MGLAASEQIALGRTENTKVVAESWLEMLRQWLVQCPQCSAVRLVVGAHERDRYICKDCGHSFVIGFNRAAERQPKKLDAVTKDKFLPTRRAT